MLVSHRLQGQRTPCGSPITYRHGNSSPICHVCTIELPGDGCRGGAVYCTLEDDRVVKVTALAGRIGAECSGDGCYRRGKNEGNGLKLSEIQ